MKKHVKTYEKALKEFNHQVCVPKAEEIFEKNLRAYRGQGYWIPELADDVDVETIRSLIPYMEEKLNWIRLQKKLISKKGIPKTVVTSEMRKQLKSLLVLKKAELSLNENEKIKSRKKSLKILQKVQQTYSALVKRVSFLTSFKFPVDHLKNRKVYDTFRQKEDSESIKISNYTFLFRKLVEDGAYDKDHTGPDIYLRTTMDTLYFELRDHGFYLSEDARYDAEYVLAKIESELSRGKTRILERLTEWENRTEKTYEFYKSLTLPQNQVALKTGDKFSTRNRQLIQEHNKASDRLKDFVYKKQAEVYNYWINRPELTRAIFVLETILLNEVGGVDGDDALERIDVARVVMNRLDKPKYLSIGKKESIYPYLKKITSDAHIIHERWLNALFKQGEFSFTYFYMRGVSKIFCPDMSKTAKKLRKKNIEIALQVLKEGPTVFKSTRYFSRASMIGRIHMDTVWEDYNPFPERPGLLAPKQDKLLKNFNQGNYLYLYAFKDPSSHQYQVLEIDGVNYAFTEKNGVKLFYDHRNPHYFRYFTRIE